MKRKLSVSRSGKTSSLTGAPPKRVGSSTPPPSTSGSAPTPTPTSTLNSASPPDCSLNVIPTLYSPSMPPSDLEAALLAVFDQAMVQNSRTVTVAGDTFPVRTTAKQKLKQIDFRFDGRDLRAL